MRQQKVERQIELPEFYSDLCHAAAKVVYGIREDDPFKHTGPEPREIATNVLKVLEDWGIIEWQKTNG